MILFYRILTTLIYPLLYILLLFRKTIKKEDSKRYKEKISSSHFNVKRKKDTKLIWFHAASIGEFKSILPIIEELNNINLEFLITTTTLSSGNLAKEELKKFLYLWQPNVIFLVDSEVWPNLIIEASNKKIPIALINARITSKTFKRWMMFSSTAKKIFCLFNI